MAKLERPFAVRVARILDKTAIAAGAAVERGGRKASLNAIIKQQEAALLKVFVPHYEQTVKLFGKRILDSLKSHADYETKGEDVFAEEAQKWIRATAASKVVDIGKTTESRIKSAIDHAFDMNYTGSQMADEIVSRTGGGIAKSRGLTIARTETHMAASYGSQASAESTGVKMGKVWIAAADERTREEHMHVDSSSHTEPVDLKEEFVVGGDSMLQPGMGSDPAMNINCRCVVAYRPK